MVKMRMMDDRFFNEAIVQDEMRKLRSVHDAILKWEELDSDELASEMAKQNGKQSPEQQYWISEHFNDRAYLLYETANVMFANLAVRITASVENFMGALCTDNNLEIVDSRGNPVDRPNWGHKRPVLERHFSINLSTFRGYENVRIARLLSNCFKHTEGKADEALAEHYSVGFDEEIKYGEVDWVALLRDTEAFLLQLAGCT